MTYTRAKLIIWNAAAYDPPLVREAAIFILGSLTARPEDISQAAGIL